MYVSTDNGVIRIGRKGIKKFAIGEEGTPGSEPFEVDVVVALHDWIAIDDSFRPEKEDNDGDRRIPPSEMANYNRATVEYVQALSGNGTLTTAEAKEFIARLREEYDAVADFFQVKSREERASPASSEVALEFSVEGS